MFKLLTTVTVLLLVSGCTTYVVHKSPVAACQAAAYEVTIDSWCGNGCDAYPISHRALNARTYASSSAQVGAAGQTTCTTQ